MKKKTFGVSLIALVMLLVLGCTKEPDTPESPVLQLSISNVSATDFTVRVESRAPETLYFIGVTTRESYDKLGDPHAVAEGFVQIANAAGEMDWSKADGRLIHQGSTTLEAGAFWSLKPKREYVVLAFGVGAGGSLTTEPVCAFVTTTPVAPSSNSFTIRIDSLRGVVQVQATTSDPYFLDCIEVSRLTDVPEGRLAEHIIGMYGNLIDNCLERGDVERDFSRILQEDTDYYVVAFGYVGGYATTAVTKVPFHSGGGELVPQECRFAFDVRDITMTGAKVQVTPSNVTTSYFWQVYNKALVDSYQTGQGLAQLMQDGLAIIAEALSKQYGFEITPAAAASMVTVQGSDTYTYTTLEPSTEYCVVAVGLDKKGRQTTPVQLSKPFATLSASSGPQTPMDCRIQVNGVTDEGLRVTVTPTDKAMTYVGMAGEGDLYATYSSDSEFLADDIALWTDMASAEGLSLVEKLQEFGLFLQGEQSYTFPEEFKPGVLYMAYTYGLSAEGQLTTGMQKVFFTIDEKGVPHEAAAPRRGSKLSTLSRRDLLRQLWRPGMVPLRRYR